MNTEMVKNLVRRSHFHLAIFVFGAQTDTHRPENARRPAGPPSVSAARTHPGRKLTVRDGRCPPPSLQYLKANSTVTKDYGDKQLV